MKLAVSGAHRTGKSTLVEELCESLPDYRCEKEVYCQLEEEGHIFSQTPSLEDFELQLEYSIKQINDSEMKVVFDRSPVDMLAYIKAVDDLEITDFHSLYQRVENVMAKIDLLVFVPIEKPDLIGCPESELPEMRSRVNEILAEWVWDLDSDVIEVSGPLLTRKNQVLKHIK